MSQNNFIKEGEYMPRPRRFKKFILYFFGIIIASSLVTLASYCTR